jgi:1-deoxy-D-xylulose 5-phosphate reductoisomerase
VRLFLAGTISFGDIPRAIESALAANAGLTPRSVADLTACDAAARAHVRSLYR